MLFTRSAMATPPLRKTGVRRGEGTKEGHDGGGRRARSAWSRTHFRSARELHLRASGASCGAMKLASSPSSRVVLFGTQGAISRFLYLASLLLKKQSPCEILTRKTFWKTDEVNIFNGPNYHKN